MKSRLVTRASDSPFVHSVSRWTIGDETKIWASPDGRWDLVVYRQDGQQVVLVTGQTTRSVELPFRPGDEILTISFEPGSYLPFLPAEDLLDRSELLQPTADRVRLALDSLEVPGFDNAEDFVHRLHQRGGLAKDELVASHFSERPLAASERSVQRHFLRTTGMSARDFFLIDRARRAVELLEQGRPAADVASLAGYSDQAHLCRSLKAIMGRTPGEIQKHS